MFLGLVTFTFVLLMGRTLNLVEMIINKGVPFGDIVLLFLCLLPSFLVITVPLSFLLGVLLGFGRLSADSEIVAMKASGVALGQMLRPVIVLALATSAATAFLTLYAQPLGNYAFRSAVFNIIDRQVSVGLQARVFNDAFDGLVLYANKIEEKSGILHDVFISDQRLGETPTVITAGTGRVVADGDALSLTLRLRTGSIHRRPLRDGKESYQVVQFDSYDINLNMGQQLETQAAGHKKKDREKTLSELKESYRTAPTEKDRNRYLVERHYRYALPLAPLIFALAGVPLGIHSNRSGRGGGFALALITALTYYFVMTTAKTFGEEGVLPAALAPWLPNILFLGLGAFLFHLTAQEKSFDPLSLLPWRKGGRR